MKSQTDGEGRTVSYEYDNMNRVTTMTDAVGKTETYTYNKASKMIGMCDFLTYNTLPFLNDMCDVDHFINMYEQNGKRMMLDDCKYLLIISAYIYKCQYEQALAILQMRFGKPGVKKDYRDAFEFINSYL